MHISACELFTIGIGPSSSHTVGPMRAAVRLLDELRAADQLAITRRVRVELFGSLGLTGKGHGSDKAVIVGLEGALPESVDPDSIPGRLADIAGSGELALAGRHTIPFDAKSDLVFHRTTFLDGHPNGIRFFAFGADGGELHQATYFSVGGGFVVAEDELGVEPPAVELPFPFDSADELVAHCKASALGISEVMLANETAVREPAEIDDHLDRVWSAMQECVAAGIRHSGTLPGGLKVERRAASIHAGLLARPEAALRDPLSAIDWVNLYALAVNEENAAGGRVVTAPTNGAAGIIPAVLHYATRFHPRANAPAPVRRFLLTAAAIGSLYKKNASISGADVGCQGEVGVACSMAAGALAEYMGGTPPQVENAAEVGMEHNLGLTCDPVGGLVQIPCIERNAMGAVKAINAARLALCGDGGHHISLDKVIRTMLATGHDMSSKYKETARGGLAVNVVEC